VTGGGGGGLCGGDRSGERGWFGAELAVLRFWMERNTITAGVQEEGERSCNGRLLLRERRKIFRKKKKGEQDVSGVERLLGAEGGGRGILKRENYL